MYPSLPATYHALRIALIVVVALSACAAGVAAAVYFTGERWQHTFEQGRATSQRYFVEISEAVPYPWD